MQQEVEKLQTQNGVAAGFAAPKTEAGSADFHTGSDLPPTKVPPQYCPKDAVFNSPHSHKGDSTMVLAAFPRYNGRL